jgi:hypothetical protein
MQPYRRLNIPPTADTAPNMPMSIIINNLYQPSGKKSRFFGKTSAFDDTGQSAAKSGLLYRN